MALFIEKFDNSFIKITGPYDEKEILWSFFKKPALNYMHTPLYKSGSWDGMIKFFNKATSLLPLGLYQKLFDCIEKYELEFTLSEELENLLIPDEVIDFEKIAFDGLNPIYIPKGYQISGATKVLSYKRGILEHGTGSGKTLTNYFFIKYLLHKNFKKILFVVPQIGLIAQGLADLKDYGLDMTLIGKYYGKEKDADKKITLGTWQSLSKNKKLLNSADAVIIDECFVENTQITTISGQKNIQEIQAGELVLTLNEQTNQYEYKEVVQLFENITLSSHLIELELENGIVIKVTPNHKFLTKNRGWIEAHNLTEEDDLIYEHHQ